VIFRITEHLYLNSIELFFASYFFKIFSEIFKSLLLIFIAVNVFISNLVILTLDRFYSVFRLFELLLAICKYAFAAFTFAKTALWSFI